MFQVFLNFVFVPFAGSYTYDRDGKFGYRFFCVPHFGLTRSVKREEQTVNKENIPNQPTPKTPSHVSNNLV